MPVVRWATVRTIALLCLMAASVGCGGNDNDSEFNRTAVPGIPSDRPDEKVSSRRERTRSLSKQEKKIEQRNKAAEEKAEKAAKKS